VIETVNTCAVGN